MNLKKAFEKEQKYFVKEWEIKSEKGCIQYFVKGMGRSFAFLLLADIINSCLQKEKSFKKESFIIIVVISIIMPVLSWIVNELRYRKQLKKS